MLRQVTILVGICLSLNLTAQLADSINIKAGWEGNRKGYTIWWFARHSERATPLPDSVKYFDFGFMGFDTTTIKAYKSFRFAEKFRRVHKKRIKAHILSDIEQAKDMDVVYINRKAGFELPALEKALKGLPILIVAEDYGYKEGMINFLKVGKVERYTVNEEKMQMIGMHPDNAMQFWAVKTRKDWDDAMGLMEEVLGEDRDRVVLNKAELQIIAEQYKEKQAEIKKQTDRLDSLRLQIEKQEADLKVTLGEFEAKSRRNAAQLAALNKEKDLQESKLKATRSLLQTEVESLDRMRESFQISKLEQDSILNASRKEIAGIEAEIVKQNKILSTKQARIEQQEGKIEGQQNLIYVGLFALIGVLLIAFLIYRNYRQKKIINQKLEEKNATIEHQKQVVEVKNKEIVDSITYAKRLQDAILPAPRVVKQWLNESFILFKPKDIVAGDFYWMDSVGDEVIFAAADCTGHGVPGAMVSVVCANALRSSVRELGIGDPGAVLDQTRTEVIQQFDQSDADVKDGMDVALCTLNTKTREFKFAGANNPLWVISKASNYKEFVDAVGHRASYVDADTNQELRLVEIKGDKQPIGVFDDHRPFETISMKLEEGDIVYVFSDGFADQFGGPKGKKLKYKPFKHMLLDNAGKSMQEQKEIIDQAFEAWRGDHEQIDDVCVIGVRV